MARCANPESVICWQPLLASKNQAASVPGLRPTFIYLPPQLPSQLSGSSDRPSDIRDGSLEVQALKGRDRDQVRQPRIGDLFAPPAWENDRSSISARPACQALLYPTLQARPALGIITPPHSIGDDSPEV